MNYNMNNNKYAIGCVVLVCILLITFLLIRTRRNTLKNTSMENISPYVVLGALRNKDQNVILVNVLAEKIPFLIGCNGEQNTQNMTKAQFTEYLINDPQLQKVDIVILYCASWSCGAAQNYFNELQTQGLPMDKICDYKGALHEWAMYSLIFPELFLIQNLSSNQPSNNVELKKLAKDMMHTYKLKDEKDSHNNIIVSLSGSGENIISSFL
jgi:hypothetical protein